MLPLKVPLKRNASLTRERGGGVRAGGEHFDWSTRIEEADPLEGRPLLAVAEPQLPLAVPPRGEHFALSCNQRAQRAPYLLSALGVWKKTREEAHLCGAECGFSHRPQTAHSQI